VKDALNERYLPGTRNEPSPAKHNRCTLSVAMESETSDRCRHFGSTSLLSYVLTMRRFLTGAVESGGPSKVARTDSSTYDARSAAVATAPVLISPTVLLGADLAQAESVPLNQWVSYEGIMYKFSGECNRDSQEMVAFDMDGTLIRTRSGKTHAAEENDWVLWDSSVRVILQRLHTEKKYLAIVSNQSGIKDNKITRPALQRKVEKIIETIGVPMDFICAIEDDRFRKPRPGMWEFLVYASKGISARGRSSVVMEQELNPTEVPYFVLSTYVGDAAGRPKEGTRNKDWSDSDYKLAINAGVKVTCCLYCANLTWLVYSRNLPYRAVLHARAVLSGRHFAFALSTASPGSEQTKQRW
jgi:DNA 3'-phosphatase